MTAPSKIRSDRRPAANRAEQSLQKTLIQLAALYSPRLPELNRLFHIPNGGGRAPTEAKILVGQGVRPGVPDLELPLIRPDSMNLVRPSRGYHRLYLEMKRPSEDPSAAQREWIDWLRSEGNCVQVCQSVDAAWLTILWYLRPRFAITREFARDISPHVGMMYSLSRPRLVLGVDDEVLFEGHDSAEASEFVRFCRGEW